MNTMPKERCFGCMSELDGAEVCPHCSWSVGTPAQSPLYLSPGTVLNGQYLLGRVLGHGGFGITYLAWDLNLHLRLAIKEYLPREHAVRAGSGTEVAAFSGESTEFFAYGLDKFIDEARNLARFDHPNVVRILNFFRANGTGYMVMEHLEGLTLLDYLKRQGGSLLPEKAVQVLMPVMDALREVHGFGLLHRDISPDNVYVASNHQVKLIDFGAARMALSGQSHSLALLIKPGFSPEEQYRRNGRQGPWSDIYSVCATLYRMIVGQPPPEALDRLAEDTLEVPSTLGIGIAPAVERALIKGLAVRAPERYQTVEELQAVLMGKKSAARSRQGDRCPPPSHSLDRRDEFSDTSRRISGRRRSRRAGVWILLLLLAPVIGMGGWWLRQQADESDRIERELTTAESRTQQEAMRRRAAEDKARLLAEQLQQAEEERRRLELAQEAKQHRQASIERFVDRMLTAASSADVNGLLALYADRVDYFGSGEVGKTFIRDDKERFFRSWPNLRYRRTGPVSIDSEYGDGVRVSFPSRFRVENPTRNKFSEGTAHSILRLRSSDGDYLVIGEQQRVLTRNKGQLW